MALQCHVPDCPFVEDAGQPTTSRLGLSQTSASLTADLPGLRALFDELELHRTNDTTVDIDALHGQYTFSPNRWKQYWEAYPCHRLYVRKETPSGAIMLHLAERTNGAATTAENADATFAKVREVYAELTGKNPQADVSILGNTTSAMVAAILSANEWTDGEEFVNLDRGGYREFKYRGDFLVWCVPNNLLVSVKSMYAAERLLASATGTDCVGFGFFVKPSEFNVDRTKTYRRAGFMAVYMPSATLDDVLALHGGEMPENVNDTAFYRPTSAFAEDMLRVFNRGITKL